MNDKNRAIQINYLIPTSNADGLKVKNYAVFIEALGVTLGDIHFILLLLLSSSPRYCWVSPRLVEDKSYNWFVRPTPKLYIPLELTDNQDWTTAEWRERLVIGHSVGFDRSFVKEQCYIKVRNVHSFC